MKKKKILIAPLDWGLGHATRCIPIARALEEQGFEVLFCAASRSLDLLMKEFPKNQFIKLDGYNVSYPKNGWMVFSMLFQSLRILNKIRKDGIKQKIRGIIFDGGPCPTCTKPFPVYSNNKVKIGQITSGIYSPRLKKNVGLSMILKDHWNIGNEVIVETPDNKLRAGTISSLPFPG